MFKSRIRLILSACALCAIFLVSCSEQEYKFQTNYDDPEFRMFDLLDDYPALKDAFSGIDQHEFNVKMSDAMSGYREETVRVMLALYDDPEVIDPEVPENITGLISKLRIS